jgi:hypothetical protein
MKTDLYTQITDQIIAELEQGVRPWHKPWAAGHIAGPVSRPLRSNGKPYSGINILMLWATSMQRGYSAPIWMTYRQAQELGAQVRKGEKGTLVVYARAQSGHIVTFGPGSIGPPQILQGRSFGATGRMPTRLPGLTTRGARVIFTVSG